MDRKKLLIWIVVLMLVIFVLDRLGAKFFWYYTILWFDMVMHFLGGFWVGLFLIYVFTRKNTTISLSLKNIYFVICIVLLVGILWEIFELVVNNFIGKTPFSLIDTLSDLGFDLAGGFLAIFLFQRIMRFKETKV